METEESQGITTPITQVTYSSWADEVEAADLQEKTSKAESSPKVESTAKSELSSRAESEGEADSEDRAFLQALGYESDDSGHKPENLAHKLDEEEMVDYAASSVRIDINMVYYLPAEFHAANEDGEVAQIDFGPRDAIF
jgi:hypothetical protein